MTQKRNSEITCHYLELGKIGRPHGVRGDMRLFLHNPSSDFIFQLDEIFIAGQSSTALEKHRIQSVKESAKFVILSLDDVRHRDVAQKLCGCSIFVPRDSLPTLADGEFYIDDLIGVAVMQDGVSLGRVVESREQGGIEVVTVSDDAFEIQIPLVNEYVINMDLSAKRIEVHNTDSLPVFELSKKV